MRTAASANTDLVSNTKFSNQNCDSSGNTGSSTTKSNKSKGLKGLQQFLKLQQSVVTPQQSLSVNLQQPTINQNLQQAVLNQNLPINLQKQFQSLPLNLQHQILQQQNKQILPKQCNQLQQQDPVATIFNSDEGRKPSSSLRVTGISLAPLPVNNGQTRNLLSQVTQGVNLSNLGLPLNIPNFVPKSCDCINSVDQIPAVVSQPINGPISNVPIAVVERIQYPVNMPIPISTSSFSADNANLNIPIELTSSTIPVPGPEKTENQAIQSIDLAQITSSIAYQSPINQVILAQSPYEVVQMVQPVEHRMPTNHLAQKSVELDTTHIPKTAEYQPPSNQVQVVETQPVIELQSRTYVPNQQIPTSPINYPAPFVMQNNHGSKSSSMKTLLPLLFDLLKDRYWGPRNYNCGCMNTNLNYLDYYNDTLPLPQVIESYTKQRKYEQEEPPMSNDVIPEGPKSPVYVLERMKYRNYENRKNYSEEEDDDDEYEDEYDYED